MEDDQEKQFEFLKNHHLDHGDHFPNGSSLPPMKNSRMLKIKLKCNSNDSNKEYGDEEKETRAGDVCDKDFSSRKALGIHMSLHNLGSQQSEYHQRNYFNKHEEHEEEEENDYDNNNNDEVTWKGIKNENKCSSTELVMGKNHKHHQQIFIDVSAATSAATAAAVVNSNYINLSSDNNDNTCRVCGKTFPSRNSLFGHMRCHPEREWRGIEPPTAAMIAKDKNYSNSSSSISSDSREGQKVDNPMMIDSARQNTPAKRKMKPSAPTTNRCSSPYSDLVDIDLPKWSMTAKRGRRSLTDSGELNNNEKNIDVDYSDEEEPENVDDECTLPTDPGACHLMMLVMAAAQSESTPVDLSALQSTIKQRRNDKSQQDDDYSNNYSCSEVEKESSECKGVNDQEILNCNKRLRTGNYPKGGLSLNKKKKKRPKVHNKESEIGYIYDRTSKVIVEDSDVEFGDEYTKLSDMIMRKKRKTMKLKDLARMVDDGGDDVKKQEVEFSIAERFNCSSCNKSFPSHQALGGHRSSHKSNKINQPKYKSNVEELAGGGLVITREADEDEGHDFYGLVNNDNANIKQTLEDFSFEVKSVESISKSKSKLMAAAMTSSSNISMQTHRCSICGKTFPTGQALGGHKRHHGTSPSPSPSPSAVVDRIPPPLSSSSSVGSAEAFSSTNTTITTNSFTTAATGGHRVVFDFDLNELPVMEE
ncbi:uncharacterized protein LOC113288280 [Papaver somniferum]|uniref:uncharacterized protein LOC113288280 n=1 Tax=Papaver somniferum TaxID=3469 RepID=UPI000E6FA1DA|nr:uncharacterized protein LOC113288280 [Papaver somniferum]